MSEKQFYYAHGAVWCTKKPNGLNVISINDLDNGLRVANWLNELNDENEQLRNKKERYKRLSEIRQQEINNRILTIKEFINNCSDNKVRRALKKLFYSEVNEYDLSSENRKLLNENEQLKKELESFKPIIFESDGKPVALYKKGDVE